MKQTKPKRNSWLVTLSLVGAVVAFLMFVFLPGKRQIAELRETLREKRAFIASTTSLQAQIEETENNLQQCQAFNDAWVRSAGDEQAVPSTFAEINQQAKTAGTIITRFDPLDVTARHAISEFPVALSVSGSFAQTFQFLAKLEQLPQTIWLDELQLDVSRKNRQEIECSAKLVIFAANSKKSD